MRWEGDEGGPLRARAVERLEVGLATLRPVLKEEQLAQLHRRLRRRAHLAQLAQVEALARRELADGAYGRARGKPGHGHA